MSMREQPKSSKLDYLQPMIFTTSVLLFLMVTGMGVGVVADLVSDMVKSGKLGIFAARAIWTAEGILMVGLAAWVAYMSLRFLELVTRQARTPSDPVAPLPPLKRKPLLHVVSDRNAA